MSSPEQRREWRQIGRFVSQLGLAEGEPLPVAQVEELANAVPVLLDEVQQRETERDEARAWARGYEHRIFLFDTSHPPDWLTAPLEAND